MRLTTVARTDRLPLLVTRAALTAAGVDLDVALRAARSGHWSEVMPGAWLRGDIDVTRDHRQQAALALLGPRAALTGPDACRELGLRDVPDDDRVFVLAPHSVQRDLGPGVRLVRTTAEVTLYDMRGRRWADPTRAVYDASFGRTLLLEAGPRRGSAELRRAIGDVEAGARSAPEAEAADILGVAVRAGLLPRFLLNPDVFLDGKFLLSPDVWLIGTGVGGELDSRRFHGSQTSLDETLARHARADRRGIALVHRSPTRFRQSPHGFVAELAERVVEVPEPPGLVVVPRGPVLPLPRRR
jgi:hypothetical protein